MLNFTNIQRICTFVDMTKKLLHFQERLLKLGCKPVATIAFHCLCKYMCAWCVNTQTASLEEARFRRMPCCFLDSGWRVRWADLSPSVSESVYCHWLLLVQTLAPPTLLLLAQTDCFPEARELRHRSEVIKTTAGSLAMAFMSAITRTFSCVMEIRA